MAAKFEQAITAANFPYHRAIVFSQTVGDGVQPGAERLPARWSSLGKEFTEQSRHIPHSLQAFFLSDNIDAMKTNRIEGGAYRLTTQAAPNLYDHLRSVRQEFVGQPEISFYHAALIVKLRREIDVTESLQAFRALWNIEGLTLLGLLNSRWIISALDTFADHGKHEEQTAAMAVVTFFNMLKMADTEYRLSGKNGYDSEKLQENHDRYPVLWDGMRVFHLPDDDTFANMVKRMRRVLSPTPLFMLIFELLLNKAARADSMLTRLAKHHLRNLW